MKSSFLPDAPDRTIAVLLGLLYGGLALALLRGASWLTAEGARPHWLVTIEYAAGILSALSALLVLRRIRAWIIIAVFLGLLMAWMRSPWGALSQAALAARWLIGGPPKNMIIEHGFWFATGLGLAESTLVLLGLVAVAAWLPSLWRRCMQLSR